MVVDALATGAAAAPAQVVVALAASAGGIDAVRGILGGLSSRLAAAVVVVQHRTAQTPGMLARVLARATRLRVVEATEGALLREGTVYVAPPDRHMTIRDDHTIHLVSGPRIRHVLSSANPLLETAAAVFGEALLAVILTGYDSDGTDGVQSVAAAGGTVLAQDPSTARAPGMPLAAIQSGAVSEILSIAALPAVITAFIGARAPVA